MFSFLFINDTRFIKRETIPSVIIEKKNLLDINADIDIYQIQLIETKKKNRA